MIDLNFKYKDLVKALDNELPFKPGMGIVLGSGLGDFAESVKIHKTIFTSDLKDYPASTITGHKGKIHFCSYENKNLLLFQGRIHFYEGYPLSESILPAYLSYRLGCKKLLLTNAAGGVSTTYIPGDLMLVSSVNGINIKKELSMLLGLPNEVEKNKFLNFPSTELNKIIKDASVEENIELREGVYWFTKGPSYETPAEIKMIAEFGGDAVGMSTVYEAVFAASKGLDVSIISCITNLAAGISKEKLHHSGVLSTANLVKDKFERLVKRTISFL